MTTEGKNKPKLVDGLYFFLMVFLLSLVLQNWRIKAVLSEQLQNTPLKSRRGGRASRLRVKFLRWLDH